jgi:hypothetical protein
LSFLAWIRLFPMCRSRTFFAGDHGASRRRTPTAPGGACKTKILLRLQWRTTSDLLRRLLRPARSFPPFSPGPSSSHPFLLLPTRLFVFCFCFFF